MCREHCCGSFSLSQVAPLGLYLSVPLIKRVFEVQMLSVLSAKIRIYTACKVRMAFNVFMGQADKTHGVASSSSRNVCLCR